MSVPLWQLERVAHGTSDRHVAGRFRDNPLRDAAEEGMRHTRASVSPKNDQVGASSCRFRQNNDPWGTLPQNESPAPGLFSKRLMKSPELRRCRLLEFSPEAAFSKPAFERHVEYRQKRINKLRESDGIKCA